MSNIKKTDFFHSKLMQLSRYQKRLLMVLADAVALPLALWSAFALRFSELWPEEYLYPAAVLFMVLPIMGILIFIRIGLYRAVIRYIGSQMIWTVASGVMILSMMLWAAAFVLKIEPFPRTVPVNFAIIALIYVGGTRFLMRSYYQWSLDLFIDKNPVLIYGAGESGVQLCRNLQNNIEYKCVGFLDDDPLLISSNVAGRKVYDPRHLATLIDSRNVSAVFLAMPSISAKARRDILQRLEEFPVHVKTLPSMHEILAGESITSLREVQIEDLLGRDPVPPIRALIDDSIHNKVVMVTGAGGSIGSEICRQVLKNTPRCLVLYERSEYALYAIEQELTLLSKTLGINVPRISLLGSVTNKQRIDDVLSRFQVQTLYHAAAYKHVPLVEHNILEGIENNVLGTQILAEAALRAKVERFVLISTDKAVRPTNVMGATKRLAELILQDLAQQSSQSTSETIYSMVRFGNVLGSSGSVVPLFRKQIEEGGPVTVTHPEITRYFMTIPEAANLVIQAGSMAKGGDVFVLDMGEPVTITDLAKRMIRLMGFSVKDEHNTRGDIAIEYTGLRPGEKLYEELLIGDNVTRTQHPKIMRANEEMLSPDVLQQTLVELETAVHQNQVDVARECLTRSVSGFTPSDACVDWMTTSLPPMHYA
ncbi:polysaccharide biosynthesis protein [Nitrincola tibetensis]|nr:nucleoside-diphosphate sugar epimerase/dehydratase [Nitrincola tibetensis]